MAKVTIVFGILLIIVGLVGYWSTNSTHPTALIPTWFGLALAVGGFLANSRSETQRKIFAHINVTVGLFGFLGAAGSALHNYGHNRSLGLDPDYKAMTYQLIMAGLMLIYVNLCIQSFIKARRSREAE